jgi:hypothetical protein
MRASFHDSQADTNGSTKLDTGLQEFRVSRLFHPQIAAPLLGFERFLCFAKRLMRPETVDHFLGLIRELLVAGA